MKKMKGMALSVLILGALTGCSRFSPEGTAVSVGKDKTVTAAVFDKLDRSYYQAEELRAEVEKSVADYNGTAGEDTIQVEKFDIEEDGEVKLFMEYAAAQDYAAFNHVAFYVGDITDGYNNGGYRFETTFHAVEKGEFLEQKIAREEIFAGPNHPMVVFSEPMEVEVPGNIIYVSSNVEVTGKKSARMAGSGVSKETETQSETADAGEEDGIQEITPTVETTVGRDGDAALAYIIYEE